MKSEQYYCGEMALLRSEYEKLLSVCKNHEEKIFIMMSVSMGFRREDIINLQKQNIDLNRGTITLQEKRKRNRTRTIPMPPKLRNELVIYLKSNILCDGPLFSFKGRQAYNKFNVMCDRAGIERRPFHALRATCAKFCQEKGWTIEETARFLGDTVATIERHYTIPSSGQITQAVNEKEII